jgi:hypothetical protein
MFQKRPLPKLIMPDRVARLICANQRSNTPVFTSLICNRFGVAIIGERRVVSMPRECIFRTDQEWARIRARYETACPRIGLRQLAKEYELSESTVMKRAAREGWKQAALQVASARKIVAAATDQAIQLAASDAARAAATSIVDQLQPWIEQEKIEHVKSQVERAKRNLRRLDKYVVDDELLGAKEEAHYAKSIDIFDNVTRRNLGMSEGSGINGALSVNILAGQAAIAISRS